MRTRRRRGPRPAPRRPSRYTRDWSDGSPGRRRWPRFLPPSSSRPREAAAAAPVLTLPEGHVTSGAGITSGARPDRACAGPSRRAWARGRPRSARVAGPRRAGRPERGAGEGPRGAWTAPPGTRGPGLGRGETEPGRPPSSLRPSLQDPRLSRPSCSLPDAVPLRGPVSVTYLTFPDSSSISSFRVDRELPVKRSR